MKKFVILFVLVVLASAAPAPDLSEEVYEKKKEKEVKDVIAILRSDQNQQEDGSYNFGYEASDGTAREESADVINKDTDDESISITGSYRYIDANGEEVVVNYTAGKNGFVPTGSHIAKEITEVAAAAKDLPSNYSEDSNEPLRAPRE